MPLDLAPEDLLRLPSGRHVRVDAIAGGRVACRYCTPWGEDSYQDAVDEADLDLALAFLECGATLVRQAPQPA